ncbi:DASH complex subunit ask1, partial [Elasticomyces elasticus]
TATHTTLETSQSYDSPSAQHMTNNSLQDIDLSNLTISPSHSTPRPGEQKQKQKKPTRSPEKVEVRTKNGPTRGRLAKDDPQTPIKQTQSYDDTAMTPEGSPEATWLEISAVKPVGQRKTDPILYTVLDRNYRIQATPLTAARADSRSNRTPTTNRGRGAVQADSSPLAPPELHAEVFDSPVRKSLAARPAPPAQRTPGISVLTPARNKQVLPQHTPALWDSDEEDDGIDEETGMPYGASPPKTMSFHVPQSRLLRTPAREASKQIVDNILVSAGVGRSAAEDYEFSEDFDIDLDVDEDYQHEEDSPSVVRQAANIEDETFG